MHKTNVILRIHQHTLINRQLKYCIAKHNDFLYTLLLELIGYNDDNNNNGITSFSSASSIYAAICKSTISAYVLNVFIL